MAHTHDKNAVFITDEELMRISSEHKGYRFERVGGELIVKAPVGKYSGCLESRYLVLVNKWADKKGAEVYGSSIGFKLPNGDVRSPDVSVLLPTYPFYGKKMEEFIPGVPDFLIEIRSKSDSLTALKEKMGEWVKNGCRLAVLIDYLSRKVYVYRADGSVTEYPYDATITGEDVLPGFSFCPAEIDK